MEPNSYPQRWLAEALGTGFLVFIGAGSIPATLILGNAGKVPFSMADLGMISFAFMLVIVGMVYALGHISGCHIIPPSPWHLRRPGSFRGGRCLVTSSHRSSARLRAHWPSWAPSARQRPTSDSA